MRTQNQTPLENLQYLITQNTSRETKESSYNYVLKYLTDGSFDSKGKANRLSGTQTDVFILEFESTRQQAILKFFKQDKKMGDDPLISNKEIEIQDILHSIQSQQFIESLCIPHTLDQFIGIQLMSPAYCDLYSYIIFLSTGPSDHPSKNQVAQQLLVLYKSLKTLHDKNIFHRDIKLENILIGTDGKLKLCDFGASEIYSKEDTSQITLRGTREYWPYSYIERTVLEKKSRQSEAPLSQLKKNDIWALFIVVLTTHNPKKVYTISDSSLSDQALKILRFHKDGNRSIKEEFIVLLFSLLKDTHHSHFEPSEIITEDLLKDRIIALTKTTLNEDILSEIINTNWEALVTDKKIRKQAIIMADLTHETIYHSIIEINAIQLIDVSHLENFVIDSIAKFIGLDDTGETSVIKLPIEGLNHYTGLTQDKPAKIPQTLIIDKIAQHFPKTDQDKSPKNPINDNPHRFFGKRESAGFESPTTVATMIEP